MRRDLDLVRTLMLALEANDRLNGRGILIASARELFPEQQETDDILAYHLMQIIDEGWLDGEYIEVSGDFIVRRLTADGHDFVDATRQPTIWDQAKSAIRAGGSESSVRVGCFEKGSPEPKLKSGSGTADRFGPGPLDNWRAKRWFWSITCKVPSGSAQATP